MPDFEILLSSYLSFMVVLLAMLKFLTVDLGKGSLFILTTLFTESKPVC
jgi:hypothetical protein